MPKILRKLRVDFASLCDEPANKDARILLFKRHDGATEEPAPLEKILRRDGDKWCVYSHDGSKNLGCHDSRAEAMAHLAAIEANKAVEKVGRKVSRARLAQMKAALKALHDAMADLQGDDEEEEDMKQKTYRAGLSDEQRKALPDDVRKYLESVEGDAVQLGDLRKQLEDSAARIATLEKADDAPPPEPEIPEAVQKQLDDVRKQNEELRKQAKDERDRRETAEAIAKAEQELGTLGDPAVIGPILKRAGANELTDADKVELYRLLKASSEQIRQSDLFRQMGKPGHDASGSASDTIDKLAKQMVADKVAKDYGEAIQKLQRDETHRELFQRRVNEWQ